MHEEKIPVTPNWFRERAWAIFAMPLGASQVFPKRYFLRCVVVNLPENL